MKFKRYKWKLKFILRDADNESFTHTVLVDSNTLDEAKHKAIEILAEYYTDSKDIIDENFYSLERNEILTEYE